MHAALNEGKDVAVYHAPELKPILQDTYGILVYQEQIIRIAAELAGYEPGEADMIRKAVSKKKRDLMDEHKAKFTAGAMARGFTQDVCDAIWGDIEFFARYGFNKAHAADYAIICCQTAYLKAHYPVEYITALLTVDHQDTEKVAKYVTDARHLGIAVAPPGINRSMLDFTIEDGAEAQGGKGAGGKGRKGERVNSPATSGSLIRYGLAAIKNAGESAVQVIIDERETNGQFKDPVDLADRVDLRRVGKRALESMARVGVFDEWGSRSCILEALDRMVGHSGSTHAAAEAGQMTLFGGNGGAAKIDVALLRPEKEIKPVDRRELLDWEKELIGVYLTEHPLQHRLADLQEVVTARTGELDATWNGKPITLAGMVAGLRTLNTKKGQPMAFVTLEDLDGKIDLVMFPKVWAAHREMVQVNQIVVVRGTAQAEGESLSIIANSVQTKLTVAKDAAAARQIETEFSGRNSVSSGAPSDYDFWPPDDDWNDAASAPPPAPARLAAEPAPAYAVNGNGFAAAESVPPPPDETEDDEEFTGYETDEAADEPTRPDPAAVAEAQEPPPPPVVEMPERITNYELRITNEASDSSMRLDNGVAANGPQTAASEPAPSFEDEPLPVNGSYKMLVVEIRASGNWKDACRQSFRLAERYEGNAMLRLQLAGQDLVMDFPNQRVGCEAELIEQLERVPGVGRVFER